MIKYKMCENIKMCNIVCKCAIRHCVSRPKSFNNFPSPHNVRCCSENLVGGGALKNLEGGIEKYRRGKACLLSILQSRAYIVQLFE